MNSSQPAASPLPPVDVSAARTALAGIPGVESVTLATSRTGEEVLFVVLAGSDFDRDDRVIAAMIDLGLPEFQLVSAEHRGWVPDGRAVL